MLAQKKKFYWENLDMMRARNKTNYEKHKESRIISVKKYYYKNKEQYVLQRRKSRPSYRKWEHEKMQTDIQFKLRKLLRNRTKSAIKNKSKTGSAVRDLGCTISELKMYLEGQFKDGMTWENWTSKGWHIDHKIPLSFFDLTDRTQLLQAVHYSNLQPLWAIENLKKSNKILV